MKRYRKAVVAAVGAAVSVAATGIVTSGPDFTNVEVMIIVLSTVGAGITTGLATYEVRNEGSNIGATGSEVR